MEQKKYSVIVRIYNAEKYLKQCIESVISQTYKNWELVLVNDGSTDSSLQICEDFAKTDSRIKIISQPNQGGVKAQLTGFENASGNYICSLDADDWYETNLIEKCDEYFKTNTDTDLILFGYNCLYVDRPAAVFSLTSENKSLNTAQLVDFIMTSTAHALWLKIFKKELIKYTDFEKDLFKSKSQNFRSNNDLFLCLPLLFNSKKALVLKDIFYNYRILAESISHKRLPYKRIETALNTMEYFYTIFDEKKCLDEDLKYLVHYEIIRELLPEFYIILRYFDIDRKKIKQIKGNEFYKTLMQEKQLKKIVKSRCIKQRFAFFIFTKIL